MTVLNTASVLAFERKLDVSDGVLWQKKQGSTEDLRPVLVREKSVRGTISNRLKAAIERDDAKLDAEIQKPNLQRVDVATLDPGFDSLVCSWTCKIMPFAGMPSICNEEAYQTRMLEVVAEYIAEHGLGELARRYAANIANGRWLWRNRMGAQRVKVQVEFVTGEAKKILVFEDVEATALNDFQHDSEPLASLANEIEQGLTGGRPHLLAVRAEALIGEGQEVYPSQELVLDKGDSKSKILYVVQQQSQQAGIHSQKIGNAIRTIDTWYSQEAEFPIAVEPYGSVTTLGKAFRQPRAKTDFYSLLDSWLVEGQKPDVDQQHFVIAVLMRGGVFGKTSKDKS